MVSWVHVASVSVVKNGARSADVKRKADVLMERNIILMVVMAVEVVVKE
jgi:hypothetical protein